MRFAMDPQIDDEALETALEESLGELTPVAKAVSTEEFATVVDGALEAVSGKLLFSMCVLNEGADEYVAAASVGDGENRQYLLLSLPAKGGSLKVETASKSSNPAARIAEAYAGLMDALKVAA
ncbi:hypothetical protein [Mesorhizobium amorphae]|uniref:hypothetical protein n=2 Tax=Phyllobacteriaceae TaxID=69277 RepID=UPI0028CB5EFC|nr:hypothetical protein [Mesorhizobium amorphae]